MKWFHDTEEFYVHVIGEAPFLIQVLFPALSAYYNQSDLNSITSKGISH